MTENSTGLSVVPTLMAPKINRTVKAITVSVTNVMLMSQKKKKKKKKDKIVTLKKEKKTKRKKRRSKNTWLRSPEQWCIWNCGTKW